MNINLSRFSKLPEEAFDFLNVLSSGFNPKDEEHIEAAADLAYLHFVVDELDEAKAILQELIKISYDGDYNRWSWVEYAWALIGFMTGDTKEFQRLTDETLKSGSEAEVFAKARVYKRFQEGQTLTEDDIEEAIEDGNLEDEYIARSELLMAAMRLHSLGGGEPGFEELGKIIAEQKKQIMDRFGLAAE